MRILILGGSTEASALARLLATDSRFDATLSLAGRTASPMPQPIQVRTGGFGGASGLACHLRQEHVGILVDATHPFASGMSRNAIEAAAATNIPFLAIERPAWKREPEDNWIDVADLAAAVTAVGTKPRTVFCGMGRLALPELRAAPQHRYIVRLIDMPETPHALPNAIIITARGPFTTKDDIRLFLEHGVQAVLAKNSGGTPTISKIEAARALGVPVYMVRRPPIPPRPTVSTPEEAMAWLAQHYDCLKRRGV
ncbi:MAG: cobalt-precorrin-6A reductase [Rhodomicrobium sp.]